MKLIKKLVTDITYGDKTGSKVMTLKTFSILENALICSITEVYTCIFLRMVGFLIKRTYSLSLATVQENMNVLRPFQCYFSCFESLLKMHNMLLRVAIYSDLKTGQNDTSVR